MHSHENIINYYEIPLKRYSFGTYLYKEKKLMHIYMCVFWEKVCLVCLKKPIKSFSKSHSQVKNCSFMHHKHFHRYIYNINFLKILL